MGRLLITRKIIILGSKSLTVTNTPAYSAVASVTKKLILKHWLQDDVDMEDSDDNDDNDDNKDKSPSRGRVVRKRRLRKIVRLQ